jgi:hypothetical protein
MPSDEQGTILFLIHHLAFCISDRVPHFTPQADPLQAGDPVVRWSRLPLNSLFNEGSMMRTFLLVMMMTLPTAAMSLGQSTQPAARPPLQPTRFSPLPLGSVKPHGWLRDQLVVQANGLTGHIDEFWKDLSPDSAWRGGAGEGWERGPYYLDGLVPLAYLLDDPRLIQKVKPWIEWTLSSSQPNGWFGPVKNKDRWPLAIMLKVLTQYHEATNDPRALAVIQRYFDYLKTAPPDWPDKDWRGVRASENVLAAVWLYRRTGNAEYLKVAESIFANSYDWAKYFNEFPYKGKVPRNLGHNSHVVNVAMAVKYAGLRWLVTGDEQYKKAAFTALANLDQYHGQVAGRFGGDEHLAGTSPSQGTELCAVVEEMFSLAHLSSIFGDASFADRTEMLAYNALPGTTTHDFWAHQYDQQANQVLVNPARRLWTTNGNDSNLYGLEPNFGCCTSNMHQGWPKLVSHMWMTTPDQGLAAVVYGPSIVTAKVAGGTTVTITQSTDYPFDGAIRFTFQVPEPVEFPLHLRVPRWAKDQIAIKIGSETISGQPTGDYIVLKRAWKQGDALELVLPMKLRMETRYNNAAAIYRGPLVFSLKIGERYEKLRSHHQTLPTADWAIYPQSHWNYGLLIDPANLDASITVATRKPAAVPFAQASAPVTLSVKGKLIPEWGIEANSAASPPPSPVTSPEPVVNLELIPYGCTRLRITEFPVVKP